MRQYDRMPASRDRYRLGLVTAHQERLPVKQVVSEVHIQMVDARTGEVLLDVSRTDG